MKQKKTKPVSCSNDCATNRIIHIIQYYY